MIVEQTALGIALANLDRLDYYRNGRTAEIDRALGSYVEGAIRRLPWFSGLPVRAVLWFLGVGIVVTTGRSMDRLSVVGRQRVFRLMQRLPLFGMVNKLVVSLTYLRLFDLLPVPGAGPE